MKFFSFVEMLNETKPKALLFDAHGTLYNEDGAFKGVPETIAQLQVNHTVKIVTNNSYLHPAGISERLAECGIFIPSTDVLSSGAGLSRDPSIRRLIEGKHALVLGRRESIGYVEDARPNQITILPDTPSTPPDVVVITSSFNDENVMTTLIDQMAPWSHLPFICCNPDRYIMLTEGELYPVVGYYADLISNRYGVQMTWIGKPTATFSEMVRDELSGAGLGVSEAIFVDDNPENVGSMARDLGLIGCWVTETGLGRNTAMYASAPWQEFIRYAIPSVGTA